jgi:hypothetical protein
MWGNAGNAAVLLFDVPHVFAGPCIQQKKNSRHTQLSTDYGDGIAAFANSGFQFEAVLLQDSHIHASQFSQWRRNIIS